VLVLRVGHRTRRCQSRAKRRRGGRCCRSRATRRRGCRTRCATRGGGMEDEVAPRARRHTTPQPNTNTRAQRPSGLRENAARVFWRWWSPAAGCGPRTTAGQQTPHDGAPQFIYRRIEMHQMHVITPPEETEHGTRPGGRGPGGVPGGVGSKNRGGHVRVYRGGAIPYSHFVCLFVCLSVRPNLNCQIIQIKHTHLPARFSNTRNTRMPPPRCPWATRPMHACRPKRLPLGAEVVCSKASKCKLPTTHNNHHHIDQSGLLYSDRAKTLIDDCSALYWTQELGLTCLESGRRAASNEPSCFSRR